MLPPPEASQMFVEYSPPIHKSEQRWQEYRSQPSTMEFNFTLVFVGQRNTMEGLNKEPHIILGDQFIDEQLLKYESDAQYLFTNKGFHIDNEGVSKRWSTLTICSWAKMDRNHTTGAFSEMTSKSRPSEAVDRLRPITSGKMLKVMPSDGYLQDTAKPGVA